VGVSQGKDFFFLEKICPIVYKGIIELEEEIPMEYEVVIGLEVHAQLLTESKIFCNCTTKFGEKPNRNTCPVCLGMPGVLPVLNKKTVDYTLKTALATNCTIADYSVFARKNYFYPDLPKGYQISQYELPVACDGYVELELGEGEHRRVKRVGLVRIHLEEDAGKLLHDEEGENYSYVDFNRTGVPLMEIVSRPDIESPEEASEYLRTLRSILLYLGVCDGNMEEGSFRCDANISLRPKGQRELGTKVELKNMNSFKFVQKALEYEAKRQKDVLEKGGVIVQDTRLWDADAGITSSMRGKEEAHDYRYFPDPDLVPLRIDRAWIDEIRRGLPELPKEKLERFMREYKLPEYDARLLTTSPQVANYFEECVREYGDREKGKVVSNWVMGEVLRVLKGDDLGIRNLTVTPRHLARMLKLIDAGVISGKIAKQVFEEMYQSGKTPEEIVKEKGLTQVADEGELGSVIEKVMAANPDLVQNYRSGKEKLFGFFVGEVMKETKGKANPKLVNELLKKKLSGN
jgi:aspartyl-tRNA(Asn)/glutamyl-tRNA(Gln) amidotransferase subunit B